jgi:C-terminal processing protease CtpA/Prc
MASVEIGDHKIENPIVTLSKDTTGLQATTEYDGILGAEILKHFKLYLDYGHQRVIFEPNKAFRQPFEFDSSGLVLTAEGRDLRSFRVLRVIEGSPAVEAGLREGDELVSLDGRSTSSLTLETLRASLIAPGQSRQIEVRRDGQTSRTRVMLRRLV